MPSCVHVQTILLVYLNICYSSYIHLSVLSVSIFLDLLLWWLYVFVWCPLLVFLNILAVLLFPFGVFVCGSASVVCLLKLVASCSILIRQNIAWNDQLIVIVHIILYDLMQMIWHQLMPTVMPIKRFSSRGQFLFPEAVLLRKDATQNETAAAALGHPKPTTNDKHVTRW